MQLSKRSEWTQDIPSIKRSILEQKELLGNQLRRHAPISLITKRLVTFIDDLLIALFHKHNLDENGRFCLLALGGYGRRELQLHSDIDVLLLHEDSLDVALLQRAEAFIQDGWDVGLIMSAQISTVDAVGALASQDISVISSLQDMHLLCGRASLMEDLLLQSHPLHMWSSHDYFFAKQQEQHKRYAKFGETAYNLEPNVKYGPGGLRDILGLTSIGKRHFGIKKLSDGISYGFITKKEYEELLHCQHFLWRVRFALHLLAGKTEDRLLFEHQVTLAKLFGYQDNQQNLGIEQFMKAYFNVIKRVRELNDTLMQWFEETIVHEQKQKITPLDDAFQLSNDCIEVRRNDVFTKDPKALLQLFIWIADIPAIKNVRASTIRLIREHLYLLEPDLCKEKDVTERFLTLLKTANDPFEALQYMSQYGVLGTYLISFAAVTGQMQYDLFHAYTVDQHTLFVIRNLARFLKNPFATQFPLCAKIMPSLKKREILYLAALFHDIAKGRGGDHSELGALDAEQFAIRHRLENSDKNLLVWLVRHHLLMSQTAHRQDIYDPQTIAAFCKKLPLAYYLEYLYLLTVADICATNPTLWNAWKDSLLKELYLSAKKTLQKTAQEAPETELLTTRKKQALLLLQQKKFGVETVWALWNSIPETYFLHESSKTIAAHTEAILESQAFPLVLIMPHHSLGGTEILVYMPHRDDRFAITTTILNNHQVSIQEAAVLTCENRFDLDTYIILGENDQAFLDDALVNSIREDLIHHLADTKHNPTLTKQRLSRTQAHFKRKPSITYSTDIKHTCLFLVSSDRPGLLAHIGRAFFNEGIRLYGAKIATAGERAEDMFYINNRFGEKLTIEEEDKLRQKLIEALQET